MASYVVAGRADDPTFARLEYAARQVEAACPNVFFSFQMKHPDSWKEFIQTVSRQYDFDGFPDDFQGPLAWTHEGDLVGGSSAFVSLCGEKFGLQDPPPASDPLFKEIAADNLKQVKEQNGPPFAELCELACGRAQRSGAVQPQTFDEQRRIVVGGASLEVWTSGKLEAQRQQLREAYGAGQAAALEAGLKVGEVGRDLSHAAFLHPRPLVRKHVALVPQRLVGEAAEPAEETAVAGSAGVAADAGAEVADAPPPPAWTVPPHGYRKDIQENLGLQDFAAALEVLRSLGGVATWCGLRAGAEYRHPLDTHLQVLPFPLHASNAASPLGFPLELAVERALREGEVTLQVFRNSFKHVFTGFGVSADQGKQGQGEQSPAQAAFAAYEGARAKLGQEAASCMLAFTASWLLLVPVAPPPPGNPLHEAWLRVPPPPPCALCGVVVSPAVGKDFPETAGAQVAAESGSLVSTRAEQERIPPGCPEYEAAAREVRVAARLLDSPLEVIGGWAVKP